MKLEIRFYWKELSDDGLLKEPCDYREDSTNYAFNGIGIVVSPLRK